MVELAGSRKEIMRTLEEGVEFHNRPPIPLPSIFINMRIKPTYDKTYMIRCSRGKDVQTTEVVDTNPEEIRILICKCMSGRMTHPLSQIAVTKIVVLECDHVRKVSNISKFIYTKDGKDQMRDYLLVKNLSPRQVRIEIEKAINNSNNR